MTKRGQKPRLDPSRWFGLFGTLAILLVAVVAYIAYTANFGLPWQNRYEVNVEVPNADHLIAGADVRIGGVLVGETLGIRAERATAHSAPYARLTLALSRSVGPLPVDSKVQVRPASVLGLTYVDLYPGRSRQTIPAGGTLPLSHALPYSDLTNLIGTFDRSSARGFQQALAGVAYGVAGRGTALNATIASTSQLLPDLIGVAGELAAPQTRLGYSLRAYETLMAALTPVRVQLGELTANVASTLGALADERPALAGTIEAAPSAESATAIAFTRARPALDQLAELTSDLRPAGVLLPGALGQLNSTLVAGLRPLRAIPGFAGSLGDALTALGGLAHDPAASGSLRKLHDLVVPTNQVLSVLVPEQIYCNVLGPWGQNFGSMWGSLGVGQGPALANLVLTSSGAQGEELQNARPSSNVAMDPLPVENATECQAGNEPWTGHQQLNNPGLTGRESRATAPPPGVTALARKAGLLAPIAGIQ